MKRLLAMVICASLLSILSGCGPKVDGKWSTKLGIVDTTWEFKSDGVLNLTAGGQAMAGKWALKGDKMTLTIAGKPQELTVTFDKDTMTLTPKVAAMALTLNRVKE